MKKREISLTAQPSSSGSSSTQHMSDETPTQTQTTASSEGMGIYQDLNPSPFDEALRKVPNVEGLPPIPGPDSSDYTSPSLTTHSPRQDKAPIFPPHNKDITTTPSPRQDKSPIFPPHNKDITTTPSPSSSMPLNPCHQTMSGKGFVLDLSGPRSTRVGITTLPSSSLSIAEQEETGVVSSEESSVSSSRSLSSVVPVVAATDVLMGESVESLMHSGSVMTGDLGMTSAAAATPQSGGTTLTSETRQHGYSSPSPSVKDQQSCSMQVYLQLPTGQTVPVHVPASHTDTLPHHQQPPPHQATPALPSQTRTADKSGQVATSPSGGSSGVALKKRLKDSLQQQHRSAVAPSSLPLRPELSTLKLQSPSNASTSPSALHHSPGASLKPHGAGLNSPAAVLTSGAALHSPGASLKPHGAGLNSPAAVLKSPSLGLHSPSVALHSPGSSLHSPSSVLQSPSSLLHSPGSVLHSPGGGSLVNAANRELNLAELEPVSKRPKNGSIDTEDPTERREKFLERNRAAAARCRHKRKQWISNLEIKADELNQINSKLQGEVGLLKGEVAQLKTLLLAHQNCPITVPQLSDEQRALQTMSVADVSPTLPYDISQLISAATSSSALTPVDSDDLGGLDHTSFAVSSSSE